MKTRTKAGIGGVAVVAIAVVLSQFAGLGGFGGGNRANDGDAGRDVKVNVESRPRPAIDDERPLTAPELLHVVIEENGYSMKETANGETRYRPLTIDQVVELARRTPEREGQARVRITMRPQARGGDQDRLVQRLVDAGIARETIEGGENVELEDGNE
ncbi:MAG: hypothetical protein WD066_03890 [Planctomycetaceae bacterium]